MKYLSIALLLLFSCEQEEAEKEVKTEVQETAKVEVMVKTLSPITIQDTLTFNGRLIASKEIDIIAQVSGELKSVNKNGSNVSKGQTVLEINSDYFKSGYQMALASYNMAKLNAEKIESNIKSYRELHKTGDISDDELKSYEVQYLSAKQQKWQSKNALDQARTARDNAIYKSPFSGTFGNSNLVVGQQISVGQSLGKIANLNTLKVKLSLSIEEVQRVKVGYIASFVSGETRLHGRVESISPVADTETGTYFLEILFKNEGNISISGMFGEVEIFGQTYNNVLALESEYISSIKGQSFLNTIENGKVKKTFVTPVGRIGKYDIVSNDVKKGIKYIIRSNNKIVFGAEVKVMN